MTFFLCLNKDFVRMILAAEQKSEDSGNNVLGTIVIIGLAVFLFFLWKRNRPINNSKNNGTTGTPSQPNYGNQKANTPAQPQQSIFNRSVGKFFTTTSSQNNKQTSSVSNAQPKSYPMNTSRTNIGAPQIGGSVLLVILIVEIVLCFLPTTKISQNIHVMEGVWRDGSSVTVSFMQSVTDTNWSEYGHLSSKEKSQAWGALAPFIVLLVLPVILLIINWKMSDSDKKLIIMIVGGILGVVLCFYGPNHFAEYITKNMQGYYKGGLTIWGYFVVIGYVALLAYSFVARKNLKMS